MRSNIDSAGRIVIPKPIRDAIGLPTGIEVEVSHRDGEIIIGPAPRAVRVVRRGGLRVAVPVDSAGSLSIEAVERTRNDVRRRSG
jgi:AbrB family looped-hinge helix DNA binding protein